MKQNPKKKSDLGFKTPKFKVVSTGESIDFEVLKKIVTLYQERLRKLSEISELVDFFFKEKLEYKKDLLRWKEQTNGDVLKALDKLEKVLSKIEEDDWNRENLGKILTKEAEEWRKAGPSATQEATIAAGDRGYLLWPLRAALTGKKASAGPFEIAEILGKEKTLKRIKEAKKLIIDSK